jgi:hypothetical protein
VKHGFEFEFEEDQVDVLCRLAFCTNNGIQGRRPDPNLPAVKALDLISKSYSFSRMQTI